MKKRFNKKAALITSLVLLVALLAAGAGYYYVQNMQTKGDNPDQQPVTGIDNPALSLSREIAEIAQSQGNDAAQKKIDEKISQASTKEEQADLYNLKIATVSASGDTNAPALSLQYAYKVEDIYPTFGSALNIADLEYAAGNKTVALKYYELYMARSTTSDGAPLDPTGKTFYERRIQELKS